MSTVDFPIFEFNVFNFTFAAPDVTELVDDDGAQTKGSTESKIPSLITCEKVYLYTESIFDESCCKSTSSNFSLRNISNRGLSTSLFFCLYMDTLLREAK